MRIVVLTDVHANLPALNAALAAIDCHGYDLLIHTGDAIGIGPFPAECLDRLLALPRCRCVMGNHDAWFAAGLPSPQPAWMSDGELAHHQWTHAQLDPALRATVSTWPYLITETVAALTMSFLHYPRSAENDFLPILPQPTAAELDQAFMPYFMPSKGPLIFYGHHHPFADTVGVARYINPGSLGCATTAHARYTVVDVHRDLHSGQWQVTHHTVAYDDAPLAAAFHERDVPERVLINQFFYGGRLWKEPSG